MATDEGNGPPKEAYKVVAVFPVGDGEFDARIVDLEGYGRAGPEAFTITDSGQVLLLDSQRSRVLVYEYGMVRRAIDLDQTWPKDIVAVDDMVYILDGASPEVAVYDTSGRQHDSLTLPAGALDEGMGRLVVTPQGRVAFDPDGTREFDLRTGRAENGLARHDGARTVIRVEDGRGSLQWGGVRVDVPFPGRFGALRQLGTDKAGNTLVSLETVQGDVAGGLAVDLVVRRYGPRGTQNAAVSVPLDEYCTFPNRFAQVTPGGDLYIMVVAADRVEIRLMTLGQGLGIQARKPDRPGDTVQTPDASVQLTTYASYDRATSLARANTNINQTWTYNAVNGAHSSRTDVEKPLYLENVAYGTVMNGPLRGIPYCWGGYDSYDTSSAPSTWTNFADAMTKGYLAGNTLCTGYYKTGTAGLDCAGFVAANVGLGTPKPDCFGVRAKSYLLPADLLEPMDVFNCPRYHVLHFVGLTTTGAVYTKESTIGVSTAQPHQKCKDYTRSWSWLATNGYEARTFWASTTYGTDFASAAELPLQNEVGGWTNRGEYIWYKFFANSGQALTVTLTPTPSSDYTNDVNLVVYDPNQTQVGASSNSGQTPETVSFTASTNGYYRARVYGVTDAQWKLAITSSTAGSTFDNGITLTTSATGSVGTWQYKYYRFAATAGEQVTVTLHPTSGDPDLFVYGPNRVWIGYSGLGTGADDVVSFLVNTTADGSTSYYYIKIYGYSAANFTISVAKTTTSGYTVLSDTLSGSVAQGLDAYYRFYAGANLTATVTLTPTSASADPDLYVTTSSGTSVGSSALGAGKVDVVSFTTPAAGTYIVRVHGYTAASYTISVVFTQP